MVRYSDFRCSRNVFQKQLATDIKQIKETDFVLVSPDKTQTCTKCQFRIITNC